MTDKVYSGEKGWKELSELVQAHIPAGIFILVGENTYKYCLPVLYRKCPGLENAVVIKTVGNEHNKSIFSVERVWQQLADKRATRASLLICLGGGVITDLGGFVAATFKRGMDFVHVPTSLLAMVDAALGGKTGINLGVIKNQVGVFAQSLGVFIFSEFLETLPQRQKLSGLAEMMKHALIDKREHFEDILTLQSLDQVCSEPFILRSAFVKERVVEIDPTENGLRKALNLGHTIGHAIEAYSQQNDAAPLLHGEAVAIGLICECFIAAHMVGFAIDDLVKLSNFICWYFPHYNLPSNIMPKLLEFMLHDKKNTRNQLYNFSLVKDMGEVSIDQLPSEKLIRESLHFYANLEFGMYL